MIKKSKTLSFKWKGKRCIKGGILENLQKFLYQSFDDDGSVGIVDGTSGELIIPGGAGIGIGFIISSMLNFGITFRSWLCPWWLNPPWCAGCFPAVVCGKDFGSWDFDGSALSAFHLNKNNFFENFKTNINFGQTFRLELSMQLLDVFRYLEKGQMVKSTSLVIEYRLNLNGWEEW